MSFSKAFFRVADFAMREVASLHEDDTFSIWGRRKLAEIVSGLAKGLDDDSLEQWGIRKLAEKIRSFDSEDDTSSEQSVEGQARNGMALSFHRQPPLCNFWIRWKHSPPTDDMVWVERLEDTPDCQLINPCHGCRTIHEICSSFNIKFSAKFKWPRYPGMIMSRIQQGKLTWALVHKEPVEKDVCFMSVFRVSGIEGTYLLA
jgi:hypothetical protein